LIAEIIVKGILSQFAPDVLIVNDADDFGILARSKRDANAIETALIRATARCPVGCFQLRSKTRNSVRRACDGFDFLGYHFRKRRSHVDCRPNEKNQTKFNTRVRYLAVEALDGSQDAIIRLRRYVKAWWRSFPLYDPHLADGDFFWARRQVLEVTRRHAPAALPLAKIAMEWEDTDYAPLPLAAELSELRRTIRRRRPRRRSRVAHWRVCRTLVQAANPVSLTPHGLRQAR
jgi:hypothetical protein